MDLQRSGFNSKEKKVERSAVRRRKRKKKRLSSKGGKSRHRRRRNKQFEKGKGSLRWEKRRRGKTGFIGAEETFAIKEQNLFRKKKAGEFRLFDRKKAGEKKRGTSSLRAVEDGKREGKE